MLSGCRISIQPLFAAALTRGTRRLAQADTENTKVKI
jgi:hypothetical protein